MFPIRHLRPVWCRSPMTRRGDDVTVLPCSGRACPWTGHAGLPQTAYNAVLQSGIIKQPFHFIANTCAVELSVS